MAKIEKLTPEQEATIIPFREKWRAIGLSTERVDKENTKKAITALYKRLDKKLPLFIFCPSPLFCIQQINFFKFLRSRQRGQNLRQNLGQNLWQNLEQNLRQNLEQNLRQEGKNKNEVWKEFHEYHSFWTYGQMDSAWIGFYQFMETIGIKYDDKDSELLEIWAQTAKSCSGFWTFENYVFVSDRPTKLNFDDQYRLHSEIGPAYEYSDGWAGHYLQGVHLPKEMWVAIINKTLPAKEALKIENQDQRTVAMQYLGGEKILKELGGKKFSEDKYGELWKLEEKDTNGNPYIYYAAPDPSKNDEKIYLRTAPSIKTPQEAMTRAYKLSRFGLVYKPSIRT